MLIMVVLPQEVTVWYVIPTVRKLLAENMHSKGISNKQIAEMLEVTPSAVSQYLNNKRAHYAIKGMDAEIDNGAASLMDGKPLITVINDLLTKVKLNGSLCELHKALDPSIPENCGYC